MDLDVRLLRASFSAKIGIPPFLFCATALLLSVTGCGGMQGASGPPPVAPPAFTTIDAPMAGTTAPEGTLGVGITPNDNVFGYFFDAGGVAHGFVETAIGNVGTIDAPGADLAENKGTVVTAMNTPGEVAGYYIDSNGLPHSFLLSTSGTFTDFDPPSAFSSQALCINDNGVIAGRADDINGAHAFVRDADGNFTLIDPTGSAIGIQIVSAYGVNASGASAGEYTDSNAVHHGYLRDASGNITLFDVPGAGTAANEGTEVVGINDGGTIVGGINVGVVNNVGTTHSFIRSADGTFTVFDPPQSGANSSFAEGINDSGVVVGEYRDSNLVRHGYIRLVSGTFISFDDPAAAQLPLSSTNLGTSPHGINADGEVGGLYTDANGVRHAFLATNLTNQP